MKFGRRFVLILLLLVSSTNMTYAYENVCWDCGSRISSTFCIRCDVCGWYICVNCGACEYGGCPGRQARSSQADDKPEPYVPDTYDDELIYPEPNYTEYSDPDYAEHSNESDSFAAKFLDIVGIGIAFIIALICLISFVSFIFESIEKFIDAHILKPSKNKQLPSSSSEPIVFTKTPSPTPSPKPMSPSVSSFPRQQNKYVFERYTGKFIGTLIKEDPLYVYIETSNSTRFRCLKDLFARKYELRKYKYTYYDSYDYTYHRNSRWSDRGWSREVNEEYYRMLNSDSDSDSDSD